MSTTTSSLTPPFAKPKCLKTKKCDISNIESLIETRGSSHADKEKSAAVFPNFLINNSVDVSTPVSAESSGANSPFKSHFTPQMAPVTNGMSPQLLWYLYALSNSNSGVQTGPPSVDMERLMVATHTSPKNGSHSPLSSASSSALSSPASFASASSAASEQAAAKSSEPEKKLDVSQEFSGNEEDETEEQEEKIEQDLKKEDEDEEEKEEEEEEEETGLGDTDDEEKQMQSIFEEPCQSQDEEENVVKEEVLDSITTTTKSVSLGDNANCRKKKQKLEVDESSE